MFLTDIPKWQKFERSKVSKVGKVLIQFALFSFPKHIMKIYRMHAIICMCSLKLCILVVIRTVLPIRVNLFHMYVIHIQYYDVLAIRVILNSAFICSVLIFIDLLITHKVSMQGLTKRLSKASD